MGGYLEGCKGEGVVTIDMYEIRLKCPTCDRAVSIKRYDKGIFRDVVTANLRVERDLGAHFDFMELDKMTGRVSSWMLNEIVERLGTNPDYNEVEDCSYPIPIRQSPLPGETGRVCAILLAWAEMKPTAIWEVT